MKVSELMALLATMPADAVVRFPDTYEQCEGWEEGHAYATCVVGGADLVGGAVIFYEGYEDEDEDEDEGEED